MAAKAVLQSWKEISAQVGRTQRTLQRWEQKFGFPVHRPSGKPRSAVVAVVTEIEDWLRARPSLPQMRNAVSSTSPFRLESCQLQLTATVKECGILWNDMRDLIVRQRELREELSRCRKELQQGMHALQFSLASAHASAAQRQTQRFIPPVAQHSTFEEGSSVTGE